MKFRPILTIIALSIILSSCGGDDDGSPMTGGDDDGEMPITASYNATITTNFTEENFPMDYPDNPTFGTIVVINHAPEINVFNIGERASEGLKSYIEDGDVEALGNFISGEIGEENEGQFTIQTEGTIAGEGSKTIGLSFTPTRTRVTVLASLNPSPDWFVGVNSFDIVDGNTLIESASIGLRALDAGTSGGESYESTDTPENLPISIISGPPFSDGSLTQGLGAIQLTRIN